MVWATDTTPAAGTMKEVPIPTTPDPSITRAPVGSALRHGPTPHGYATASFDAQGMYRYRLARAWDPGLPRLLFLMLNPSKADEQILDPTVTRCWGYAQAWGAGTLEIVNVFALRSTDPKALRSHADPVGPGNDEAILHAASDADLVVAGWGTHAQLGGRGDHVRDLLRSAGIPVTAIVTTKDGTPGHPLYQPGDAQPFWLP